MATLVLSLAGCFLWSTPAPERPCEEPHLWYAPDTSGDVYFGCTPPEGWTRTPVDEQQFASPPTPTVPDEADDTGLVITEAWVPPPAPDTSASPPDTGGGLPDAAAGDTGPDGITDDTGASPDTGLDPADSGAAPQTGDTGGAPEEGVGGVELPDTGLPPSLGGVRIDAEPVTLPEDRDGGVVIGSDGTFIGDDPALDLQPGEIVVGSPDGIKVLTPADTGYFIQRDVQNAP